MKERPSSTRSVEVSFPFFWHGIETADVLVALVEWCWQRTRVKIEISKLIIIFSTITYG